MRRFIVTAVVLSLVPTAVFATITSSRVLPAGTGASTAAEDNVLVVAKNFNQTSGLGPIDVRLTIDAPGTYWVYEATYEYPNHTFLYGQVNNNVIPYVTWTDFHMQISGAGSTFADVSSHSSFSQVSVTDTFIDYSNGMVLPEGQFFQIFSFNAATAGTVTISEWATVPEPATLGLLGLGGLVLLRRKR